MFRPIQIGFLLFVIVCLSIISSDDVLEYFLLEESPPDTLVGDVVRDYCVRQNFTLKQLESVRFGFLFQPDYFTVDEHSGLIRTTSIVDREMICDGTKEDCFVQFDLILRQPNELFGMIRIRVQISDINDNPPTFSEPVVLHRLSELSHPGTELSVCGATDKDTLRNGIQRYELFPSGGKFRLNVRNRADGGADLKLKLIEKVDREELDHYEMYVFAVDGGLPPKSAFVVVNVSIEDANDNRPEFVNESNEVWIREDVDVGTVVTRVRYVSIDSSFVSSCFMAIETIRPPTSRTPNGKGWNVDNIFECLCRSSL